MAIDDNLAVVSIPSKSGIPADTIVNTWAYQDDGVRSPNDNADAFGGALVEFYNTVQASSSRSVANFLSSSLSRATNAAEIEFFHINGTAPGTDKNGVPYKPAINGGPHGSAFRAMTWTLAAETAGYTPAPSELAACLSFHSPYQGAPEESGTTRPKARHRGRVYLGPLAMQSWAVEATTFRTYINTSVSGTIVAAAAALVNFGATSNPKWCVWSRENGVMQPVIGGWCDDAYDIQRRRGEKAKSRSTFGGG